MTSLAPRHPLAPSKTSILMLLSFSRTNVFFLFGSSLHFGANLLFDTFWPSEWWLKRFVSNVESHRSAVQDWRWSKHQFPKVVGSKWFLLFLRILRELIQFDSYVWSTCGSTTTYIYISMILIFSPNKKTYRTFFLWTWSPDEQWSVGAPGCLGFFGGWNTTQLYRDYIGVSKNRGIPKWMVYKGKPY